MEHWQDVFNIKLDRVINDLEFVKNRLSNYLGRNEALTYLRDETPIYVNTDDIGCPANFINGGDYEEDYFAVIRSFRKPRMTILDIGANLGVYSLRLAGMIRSGAIDAFEPVPRIRELFARSTFLNGFNDIIKIHPHAVSNYNGQAKIHIPRSSAGVHYGGASLITSEDELLGDVVDVVKLDDYLAPDYVCDLAKIDVEGHEPTVLNGMTSIIGRSRDIVLLFEKLSTSPQYNETLYEQISCHDLLPFFIDGRALKEMNRSDFIEKPGYYIAARRNVIEKDGLDRDFIYIYPDDLNVLYGHKSDNMISVDAKGLHGQVILHGPYWWLSKGYYRLTFYGETNTELLINLTERFGFRVHDIRLIPGKMSADFPVHRDLYKFELVIRALGDRCTFDLEKIKLHRIG